VKETSSKVVNGEDNFFVMKVKKRNETKCTVRDGVTFVDEDFTSHNE